MDINSIEFARDMKNVEPTIKNAIEILTNLNNDLKEKTSQNIKKQTIE